MLSFLRKVYPINNLSSENDNITGSFADEEMAEALREYHRCLQNERLASPEFVDAAVLASQASKERLNTLFKLKKEKRGGENGFSSKIQKTEGELRSAL